MRKTPDDRLRIVTGTFFLLLMCFLQTGPFVDGRPVDGGPWILFGKDTVSHDVPVQLWIQGEIAEGGGTYPLWMPPLKGGLPTVGAFLWNPLSPTLWLHAVLPFHFAQRLQFTLAFWWASLGGWWLARVLGLRRDVGLLAAVGIGLSGHVVTLVHAGHLTKILALAWLPWFAGGVVKALGAEGGVKSMLTGCAVAGLALGMAFLNGHPQIAYTMLMFGGVRFVFALVTTRRFFICTGALVLSCMIGGLVASAQLLPGMEMSALSNRNEGVAWEEAVDTSYPPGEIAEFFLPVFRGDSSQSGINRYFGNWGERLVSDYAGALPVLFAFGALMVRGRFREAGFWWFVAAFFLVVGLGQHTPLYGFLWRIAPGFDSFRSPGTFMAGTAVALPVLAALGLSGLAGALEGGDRKAFRIIKTIGIGAIACGFVYAVAHSRSVPTYAITLQGGNENPWVSALLWQSIRRSALAAGVGLCFVPAAWFVCHRYPLLKWALPGGLALIVAADLMTANAKFLRAEDWRNYDRWVAPSDFDIAMADQPHPVRLQWPGREGSLRPILVGRDALLGYHPISFELFERNLRELDFTTDSWRDFWGVTHVMTPQGPERTGSKGAVRSGSGTWKWIERTPGESSMLVETSEATELSVAEIIAPGWQYRVGEDEEWQNQESVKLHREHSLPAGTSVIQWRYRPFSWRAGLFLSAIGLALIPGLLAGTIRVRQ